MTSDQDEILNALTGFIEGELSKEGVVSILENSSPILLLNAEKELFKRGMSMIDMRNISEIYYEIFMGNAKKTIKGLGKGHPIRVLMVEHMVIKNLLRELEKIRDIISTGEGDVNKKVLKDFMHNLGEIEKHHQREENSIFPRLKDAGYLGRINMMIKEHDDFIKHEILLMDLIEVFPRYTERLTREINYLVPLLRFHALTEDVLLYSVALDVIDDWEIVNEEMEIIGYSKFTPIGDFKPMKKGDGEEDVESILKRLIQYNKRKGKEG